MATWNPVDEWTTPTRVSPSAVDPGAFGVFAREVETHRPPASDAEVEWQTDSSTGVLGRPGGDGHRCLAADHERTERR
jgi:hypothetical protein